MFHVVAYDVADDVRRLAVARILEGFGTRVQRSVFECHLTAASFRELRDRLAEVMDLDEDSVRLYRVCADCLNQVELLGGVPVTEARRYFIV
jgi:CRISPR-associated protein Cas2